VASLLDVSRTPVREVLILLAQDSCPEITIQRGIRLSLIDPAPVEESTLPCRGLETTTVALACEELADAHGGFLDRADRRLRADERSPAWCAAEDLSVDPPNWRSAMLTESDVRALRHEIRFAMDVEDVLDRILTLFSDTFPAALITDVREAVEAGRAIYSGTLLRILRSTHADDLFRAAQARRMFVDAEYGVLFSAGYGGRELQEVLCAGIRQDVRDLTHAWRVQRMVEGLGRAGTLPHSTRSSPWRRSSPTSSRCTHARPSPRPKDLNG